MPHWTWKEALVDVPFNKSFIVLDDRPSTERGIALSRNSSGIRISRAFKRAAERSLIAAGFHRETGSRLNARSFDSQARKREPQPVRMPEIAKLFPGLAARFRLRETRPTMVFPWDSYTTSSDARYATETRASCGRGTIPSRSGGGKFVTKAVSKWTNSALSEYHLHDFGLGG